MICASQGTRILSVAIIAVAANLALALPVYAQPDEEQQRYEEWKENEKAGQAGQALDEPARPKPDAQVTQGTRVKVYASEGWQGSGITVRREKQYDIRAEGKWSAGAFCGYADASGHGNSMICEGVRILSEANAATLIGKISDGGTAFVVGKDLRLRPDEDGELFLRPNDPPNWLFDNSGFLTVTISRLKPKPTPDKGLPVIQVGAIEKADVADGRVRVTGLVGDEGSPPRMTIDGKRIPLFRPGAGQRQLAKHTLAFDVEIVADTVGDRVVTLEACDAAGNCIAERVLVRAATSEAEAEREAAEERTRELADQTAQRDRVAAASDVQTQRQFETIHKQLKQLQQAARTARQSGTIPVLAADRPAIQGRNYALIIGNNHYANLPDLKTAITDAAALTELLKLRYAFEPDNVRLLLDADRAAILDELSGLRRRLSPDDRLLLYYAGHGQIDPVTEEGFWQPVDAEVDKERTWIANSDIRRRLRGIPAKHVLVIADSCFSGLLTRGTEQFVSIPQDRFFTEIDSYVSRKVISSGGTEPVADSGSGGHSVFAFYLLKALRENRQPFFASFELFNKIARAVTNNSNQKPQYGTVQDAGDEGFGDFTFILRN